MDLKGAYSEYSLRWQDGTGTENISCLFIGSDYRHAGNHGQSLRLCTMMEGEKEVTQEKLAVPVGKQDNGTTAG